MTGSSLPPSVCPFPLIIFAFTALFFFLAFREYRFPFIRVYPGGVHIRVFFPFVLPHDRVINSRPGDLWLFLPRGRFYLPVYANHCHVHGFFLCLSAHDPTLLLQGVVVYGVSYQHRVSFSLLIVRICM